jgi:hypothetical protein
MQYRDNDNNRLTLHYAKATEKLKNVEHWINLLTPCEIAVLLAYAAFNDGDSSFSRECLFKIYLTRSYESDEAEDTDYNYYAVLPSSIEKSQDPTESISLYVNVNIRSKEESEYMGSEEGYATYVKVSHLSPDMDSIFVSKPEESDEYFEITRDEFEKDPVGMKWEEFESAIEMMVADSAAYGEDAASDLQRSAKRNLKKFTETSLYKKVMKLDNDPKILNISKAKKLGLI